jgi:hypothetical protein
MQAFHNIDLEHHTLFLYSTLSGSEQQDFVFLFILNPFRVLKINYGFTFTGAIAIWFLANTRLVISTTSAFTLP